MLVAEDDEGLGEVLARGLREQGYVVDLVPDGETAATYLRFYQYEVAVLDWRMPRLSGLDLVRQLRRGGLATPVLMLTARDAPADRIAGLDAGADDYLVKPFAIEELIARIRAVGRRQAGRARMELRVGPLRMDPARHLLWLRDEPVSVSAKDFSLLQVLMDSPGVVLSREQIEDRLYGWEEEIGSNAVEVRIHNLRKKLGAEVIQTVRGVGYRIREDA